VIELVLALALAGSASPGPASVPERGVLVPGTSLAGVRLGDTPAGVRARWGSGYRLCGACAEPTWYYTFEGVTGEPLGVGVSFRRGRVGALFTLGSPAGWRTREGLRLGDTIGRVDELYGTVSWRACIGYVALSMRRGGVVTSIYATGDSVYGFALTRTDEPICQ
jgi:hypothetical protein